MGCGAPLGNCGGGLWSEDVPIGTKVQDPRRFVSDLNPYLHHAFTYGSARRAGMNPWDALIFANRVVWVDFLRHSQEYSATYTHWHSLGGSANGSRETCGQAYAGTVKQLRGSMDAALKGDITAAAMSVHTIQDSCSAAHQYGDFSRGYGGLLGALAHLGADLDPGDFQASASTEQFLRDLSKGTFGPPASYLSPPPGACR